MSSGLSDQTLAITPGMLSAAVSSLGLQTASQVDAAIAANAPAAVLPLIPPPLFRFSVPGSLVGVGVIFGAIADRAGTLASMQVRCSALTSGTYALSLKKNGAVVKSWSGSTATQVIDLSTPSVAIVSGDLLTIEVTAFSLVVGLGVTYGFIKAS